MHKALIITIKILTEFKIKMNFMINCRFRLNDCLSNKIINKNLHVLLSFIVILYIYIFIIYIIR